MLCKNQTKSRSALNSEGKLSRLLIFVFSLVALSDYSDTRLSAVGSDETICLFTAFAVIDPIVAEITAETTIEENEL
jgi:hypothetical protein